MAYPAKCPRNRRKQNHFRQKFKKYQIFFYSLFLLNVMVSAGRVSTTFLAMAEAISYNYSAIKLW